MISRTSPEFRADFARLPMAVKRDASEAFRLFTDNPRHPGLKFKKLSPHVDLWSVRVNNDYRAIARLRNNTLLWFFIGSHADYDKYIARP